MYLKLVLPTTFLLGISGAGHAEQTLQKEDRSSKPNIIYILADDLGIGDVGYNGQKLIETPNIARLRSEGITFTNHYTGQAVSGPSRCSLFTGLHQGHAYIRGNDAMPERGKVWDFDAMLADSTLEGQRPVPGNTIMIPKALKKAGYVTGCVGKWGLGYPGSESTPNKMGFDFFYGYNCQRQAHTYYPPFLYRNECREYLKNTLVKGGSKLDKGADPRDLRSYAKYEGKQYAPDLMYDEILKFVETSKQQPFLLFWTTIIPHVPLQAPKKWVDYYVNKFGDEEPYLGNQGYFPCRYPHATYAAMISYWDEQIGGLIAKLKELGIYENTLIIFTSDNGPTYNGGSDTPYFKSAAPHRSQTRWIKGSLREGGIHAPMVACWPGKIKPGTSSNLLSAFWDMMPTMCEIAGVDCPPTDGISLLPTMLGKTKTQKKHDFLFWEYPEAGGQKAVRMGDWKAFVGNIRKGNRKVELYNVVIDPREEHDVASEHPEIVKKVLEIFRTEHTDPEIEKFKLPVW